MVMPDEATPEDFESDIPDEEFTALKELAATRVILAQVLKRLEPLQDAMEERVNARTRPWRWLAVFTGLVALAASFVAYRADDTSRKNEEAIEKAASALVRAEEVRVELIGTNCESGNDIREGFLLSLEAISNLPRDGQTDPAFVQVVAYFEKRDCAQLVQDAREASPVLP